MSVDDPTPVISTSSSVSKSFLFVNQVSDAFGLNDPHHVNVVSVPGFPHPRLNLIKCHGEIRRYLFRGSERTRHNNGLCCTSKTHRKMSYMRRNSLPSSSERSPRSL